MAATLVSLGFFLMVVGVGAFVWYYLDLFGERLPTDNERAGRITFYVIAGLGAVLTIIGAAMIAST